MTLRQPLALGLAIFGLLAAGLAAARQDPAERLPEELAKAYVESYNAHDASGLANLLAEDVTVRTPDLTEVKGREEQRKYFTAWFKSVPDVKSTLKTLVIEGDLFAMELRETGTYTVRLPGPASPPARGQKLDYPYMIIARARKGQIASMRIYENDLLIEKQLGIR